jgi:pyruvate, water dikinase
MSDLSMRRAGFTASVVLGGILAVCASCSDSNRSGDAGGDELEPLDPEVAFVNELRSRADLEVLSAPLLSASVKYLARIEGKDALGPLEEACYFQNMNRYPWHLQFLQSFMALRAATLDSYRGWVLQPGTRRMWGGSVRSWPEIEHPKTGARGVITYDVYSEPGGLDVDDIASVDERLDGCIAFARNQLVFVPTAPDQEGLVRMRADELALRGIATLLPSDLIGELEHVAYSEGEGYGYLRVVARDEPLDTYGPRDVVVVTSAPNDISVVAGLVTMNPQNELGHVNLRLDEKGIPNAAVPDIYQASWLTGLDTRLVHIEVSEEAISVTAAELADAEAFWAAHRPKVRMPSADLEVTELHSLRELRASDSSAYGSKAANLGELTHVLSAPHRPDGFGVPLSRYRDFAASEPVKAAIDALLQAPGLRTDAAFKRAALDDLRSAIKAAPLDPAFLTALQSAIEAEFGEAGHTTYLRFRSSTNVEDLDAFTGAGLYDSRSGCLADDLDDDALGPSHCLKDDKLEALETQLARRMAELEQHPDRTWLAPIIEDIAEDLSEEKPIAGAVRKVFASLWNERAFDEREYYGIDQRAAYMGLAVHPAYALEQINAVAVSNLALDDGAPLYRVNSQVGELSVVRPEDPTAIAELLTFRRAGTPPEATDIEVQLASSLVPEGDEVWPRDKLLALSQLLFTVHDHFERAVYPDISPLSLDFEVKLERTGDVVIKQVRPYLSTEPMLQQENEP